MFETEKTHIRSLHVLRELFVRPLGEKLSTDLCEKLFSNLDEIIHFHESFNARMIAKVEDEPQSLDVGGVLSFMVNILRMVK